MKRDKPQTCINISGDTTSGHPQKMLTSLTSRGMKYLSSILSEGEGGKIQYVTYPERPCHNLPPSREVEIKFIREKICKILPFWLLSYPTPPASIFRLHQFRGGGGGEKSASLTTFHEESRIHFYLERCKKDRLGREEKKIKSSLVVSIKSEGRGEGEIEGMRQCPRAKGESPLHCYK